MTRRSCEGRLRKNLSQIFVHFVHALKGTGFCLMGRVEILRIWSHGGLCASHALRQRNVMADTRAHGNVMKSSEVSDHHCGKHRNRNRNRSNSTQLRYESQDIRSSDCFCWAIAAIYRVGLFSLFWGFLASLVAQMQTRYRSSNSHIHCTSRADSIPFAVLRRAHSFMRQNSKTCRMLDVPHFLQPRQCITYRN